MSIENLCSGLLGSIIGILASIGLFIIKEQCDANACINAIKAELKTLKRILYDTFEPHITNDDTPLWFTYPLDTDYFTIYNNNSINIGRIKNKEEREVIISIYTLTKYFLDCLRTNNECIQFYETLHEKCKNDTELVKSYNPDLKLAESRLRSSKRDNILPTFLKLKELFNKLKY